MRSDIVIPIRCPSGSAAIVCRTPFRCYEVRLSFIRDKASMALVALRLYPSRLDSHHRKGRIGSHAEGQLVDGPFRTEREPSRLMLIRLFRVTTIFTIGHNFGNLIATTYRGNLSQADKQEPPSLPSLASSCLSGCFTRPLYVVLGRYDRRALPPDFAPVSTSVRD